MEDVKLVICVVCGCHVFARNGTALSPGLPDLTWAVDAVLLDGPICPKFLRELRAVGQQGVSNEGVKRYDLLTCVSEGRLPDGSRAHERFRLRPTIKNERVELPQGMPIIIHSTCEEMAIKFMLMCRQASFRSMDALWDILHLRRLKAPWCARGMGEGSLIPLLPTEPPEMEVRGRNMLGVDRYCAPAHLLESGLGRWDSDPIQIPDIFDALLHNLKEARPVCDVSAEFRRRLGKLPYDVQSMIVASLLEEKVALECNYLMPQNMWREFLFQIPFLWDIDSKMMQDRTVLAGVGSEEWDWEQLSRKLLASPTPARENAEPGPDGELGWILWDYRDVGLELPPGLTNRRRIWEILTEMHPDDVGSDLVGVSFPNDMPIASTIEERGNWRRIVVSSARRSRHQPMS